MERFSFACQAAAMFVFRGHHCDGGCRLRRHASSSSENTGRNGQSEDALQVSEVTMSVPGKAAATWVAPVPVEVAECSSPAEPTRGILDSPRTPCGVISQKICMRFSGTRVGLIVQRDYLLP